MLIRRNNKDSNAYRFNYKAYISKLKDSKSIRDLFKGLSRRLRVVITNYSPNLRVDIVNYISRLLIIIDSIKDRLYALV